MATKRKKSESKGKEITDALKRLGNRMDKCVTVKSGDIDLHLSGASGGEYRISSARGKNTVAPLDKSRHGHQPRLEVWGDADLVRAIIEGDKNPVKLFLVGGLRVRGNLRYLSEVGQELGILEKPL